MFPGYEDSTMAAYWTFESGRLVARNEAGATLRWWLADDAMGQALAMLLNQANDLSRLFLWPLLDAQED